MSVNIFSLDDAKERIKALEKENADLKDLLHRKDDSITQLAKEKREVENKLCLVSDTLRKISGGLQEMGEQSKYHEAAVEVSTDFLKQYYPVRTNDGSGMNSTRYWITKLYRETYSETVIEMVIELLEKAEGKDLWKKRGSN